MIGDFLVSCCSWICNLWSPFLPYLLFILFHTVLLYYETQLCSILAPYDFVLLGFGRLL